MILTQRIRRFATTSAILCAALTVTAAHAQRADYYTITDLGAITNFGGTSTQAYGISPDGRYVVGTGAAAAGNGSRALLYDANTNQTYNLGFVSSTLATNASGIASSVNNGGQIAGRTSVSVPRDSTSGANLFATHAFRSTGTASLTAANDMGTIATSTALLANGTTETANSSQAYGINASGQTTGFGTFVNDGDPTAPGSVRAFRNNSGTLSAGDNLGVVTGFTANSQGRAINDSGQVTGFSGTTTAGVIFRTTATGLVSDAGASLGNTLTINASGGTRAGGAAGDAFGINNSGRVTGSVRGTISSVPYTRAFRSDDNTGTRLIDLGVTITRPNLTTASFTTTVGRGINATGDVVGQGVSSTDGNRAFLYTGADFTGNMYQLDNFLDSALGFGTTGTGWTLRDATGISDNGRIVGFGDYFNGSTTTTRAFVLTPQVITVPEASAALLTGAGLVAGSGAFLRRRRRN